MNAIINSAIEKKLLLSFTYEGLFRIVEPHCYGISTKGSHCLRAFQVDGESSSGNLGWKLYDISKASNILLLEHAFPSIRDGYKKGDKQMTTIIIEL
jgi:hypothetical protein